MRSNLARRPRVARRPWASPMKLTDAPQVDDQRQPPASPRGNLDPALEEEVATSPSVGVVASSSAAAAAATKHPEQEIVAPISPQQLLVSESWTAVAELPVEPNLDSFTKEMQELLSPDGSQETASVEDSFLAQAQRMIAQSQDQADKELQEQRRERRARDREQRLQRLKREREKLAKQVLEAEQDEGVSDSSVPVKSRPGPWQASAAAAYGHVPGRLHQHSQATSQLLAAQSEAGGSIFGSCFSGFLTSLCGDQNWSLPGLQSWSYEPVPDYD